MSGTGPPTAVPRGPLLDGETIVHFVSSPGIVKVELRDLDSLLDRNATPTYPHRGPMLDNTVARFMVDTVREARRSPDVEVTITLRSSPLLPEEEAGARAHMSHFFANESEVSALGQRVNRTEAWGSLRYALPGVIVAGLIALLLTNPSAFSIPVYLAELGYLVVVVVIWVLVWDPVEKVLFDSYFIRLRIRALHKLAAAKVVFAYRPGASAPMASAPIDASRLDSVKRLLEG